MNNTLAKIRYALLILLFGFAISARAQVDYKQMMDDPSFNFYEVVDAAEKHFSIHPRGKGSGYIGYLRWKYHNEPKYYPSGDRSGIDPFMVSKSYSDFVKQAQSAKHKTDYDNEWIDLGPYSADSITSHYSAGIGRVECFYVDPLDTMKIYMGSRSGGFWRTTDEGKNWQNTTDYLPASGVNTMDASPTNSDSVLINLRNAYNSTTHGIYRSTDGGITWTLSNFNPTQLGKGGLGSNFRVNMIKIHPRLPNLVFVGTNGGLYRSDNSLQTYTLVKSGNTRDIEFHPTDNQIIYVSDFSVAGIINISTNQGLNFHTSGPLVGNGSSGFVSTTKDNPDAVYFASNSGLWKSNNKGTSFNFLINPNESCQGMEVSDVDSMVIIYGYVDLERSLNGGDSFNQITVWSAPRSESYVHADLRNIESLNGVFYVGTDGYFCKTNDNGTTWTKLNRGTGIRENYRSGISQSNAWVNMCGSQDNGTSIFSNNHWIEWNGGDGMEAIVHPLNKDWMIGSWQYGTRNRTKDGGQSRHGISTPQSGSSHASWVSPLLLNPLNHQQFFHFSSNVHKAYNFGDRWEQRGSANSSSVRLAAIAENDSNIIAASSYSDLRISKDGGWSFSPIPNTDNTGWISRICFDPKNDQTMIITYSSYVANNKKIYISYNQGQTWQNITYNLGDMPIYSVAVDHQDSSFIYIGTEIGIYYKSMLGTRWNLYNKNLPNVSILDLDILYGTNTIRATTWGRGLWENSLIGRIDFPSIVSTTTEDVLDERYPNTRQDQTITSKISYEGNLTSVYLMYSVNSIALDSRIEMIYVSDSTWISQGELGSRQGGDQIYFKVFAVGENQDTTETYRFMYTVKPFQYCFATGDNSTTSDYINSVKLNGMVNTSDKEGYGNFTDTVVHLQATRTYELEIGMQYHWDPDTTAAWIDFNLDGTFDTTEWIEMGPIDDDHNSFGSFTVPANAVKGDTLRMRVRNQYWYNSPNPCGSETGEVEDYSIVIDDFVSAIDEHTQSLFTVYPNPGRGSLNLLMKQFESGMTLKIYNLQGIEVFNMDLQTPELSINLSAGTYIVELIHKDEVSRSRWIVQ
ncbi:MAG: T9SS type A sorting domain-containing protein [Bacteroidia bacterium]